MTQPQPQTHRLLAAIKRQPVDKTPVWVMRQAGRYLPEYRKIRAKVNDFLQLCQNPELACSVTLQPLQRYPLDSTIVFSDILIIPHAMGMPLAYKAGEGPQFAQPIRTAGDINALSIPDPEQDMPYTQATLRLLKHELGGKLPIIGFAGSPWTVACYMVEGAASKNFSIIKGMHYQNPELLSAIIDKVTEATILSLSAQIRAGADVVMLFDTWGSVLSTPAYQQRALAPMTRIIQALKAQADTRNVPVICFTKQGSPWLALQAASGCDVVGVDWTVALGTVRRAIGERVAIQGNMDPCALYGSEASIRSEVRRCLDSFGAHPGHIFNLGHGIYPDVDPGKLAVMIDEVHTYSAAVLTSANRTAS